MQRTKWVDRRFTFDLPEGWLPDVLERLRGTPARIAEMTSGLSDEKASQKQGDAWSIKEHIGHLADLEELHEGRIDDFIARKETLRAADMSNTKTNEAGHNRKSVQSLLASFSDKRHRFIKKLEQLDDETQKMRALHPRLQMPMRPIDAAFFAAEHDDHHLATMRQILEKYHQ